MNNHFNEIENIEEPIKISDLEYILLDEIIDTIQLEFDKIVNSKKIKHNIYKSNKNGVEVMLNQFILVEIFQSIISESILVIEEGEIDVFVKYQKSFLRNDSLELSIVCTGLLSENNITQLEHCLNFRMFKNLLGLIHGHSSITKTSGNSITISLSINLPKDHNQNTLFKNNKPFITIQDKRGLIVDDSSQYAKLFSAILNEHNVNHDIAINGKIGLELIETFDYDFILMDLQMPVLNGFETIQSIRNRSDEKRNLKIIAVTSCNGDFVKNQCKEAGFTDFLHKPVNSTILIDSIKNVLQPEVEPGKASTDPNSLQLDMSYLHTIANGDEAFKKDLLESSVEDIDEKITDLENNLKTNNVAGASDCVHSLKSLLAIVGLTNLYNIFDEYDNLFNKNSPGIPISGFDNVLLEWNVGKKKILELYK